MSWEAKACFLGLMWETVSRTSSGKFLRVESCYPESFGFLCLWMDPTWGKVSLTHLINNRLFWLVSPLEIVRCLRQIDWCRGRVTQVVLKIASLLLSSLFVSCKHHHWLLLSLFVSCKNHHYYYNHYFCPANTIIIFADNWPPHLSTSSLTFKSKWVFDSLEVEEARELLGYSLSCQKSTPRDVPGHDACCFKRRIKNA